MKKEHFGNITDEFNYYPLLCTYGKQSPGFINYFIIAEHLKRFTVSNWQQDLYGTPKSFFHGMIWIFLMVFSFPWIQFVFFYLWKKRKLIFKDKYLSFFVLWLLWTPIFFTFSKNILHTYVLPVMVPVSILVAYWWKENKIKKLLLIFGSLFPAVLLYFFYCFINFKTDKYLLQNQYNKTTENFIPT